MNGHTDFEFRHHLYDTIVLLGGKKEIADLLKKSLDFGVTEHDILRLKNYNADLTNQTKGKLTQINGTTICVDTG